LVRLAEKCLWSPAGQSALDYLHKRGLTDTVIRFFHLGYLPRHRQHGLWIPQKRETWGLEPKDDKADFGIRSGIIIPLFDGNTLWKINIRILAHTPKELERQAEGKQLLRYTQVEGGQNGLFNVDTIRPGQPLFLTEGPFDAIIGQQETGHPFLATCGTNGALMARWTARLSQASHIILAFDNDEGKGEAAAAHWVNIFKGKAVLWLPTVKKDITDMWLQGHDIKQWAAMALKLISHPPVVIARLAPTIVHSQLPPAETAGDHHLEAANPLDNPVPVRDTDELVERFKAALPGWNVSTEPRATWQTRKAEILQQYRESMTCRAVWHLNKNGKPCKAWEQVARVEVCGCTVWVQSAEGEFCAKCYTSRA
jgi:hypothetical protein